MNNAVKMVQIVLPVLIALGLGYLSRRKALLSEEAVDGLKTLAMRFALPAMLFGVFYNAAYSTDILVTASTMFLMGCLGLALGFLLSRLRGSGGRLIRFMTSGWEVGMLGYALYVLLFGQDALRNMAIFDLGQVLFVFTVYVTLLNTRDGGSVKRSLAAMLQNPIPWSIALGVLFGATGLAKLLAPFGVSAVVSAVCDFVSAPLSCVILVVVGYGVSFTKESFGAAVRYTVLRLLVCAALCAITVLICRALLPMTAELLWAIVFIFLTPAPFILTLYTRSDIERAEISAALSLQTIVTIVAFIGAAAFLL